MGFNILITLIIISIILIIIVSSNNPKKSKSEFSIKHIPFFIIVITMIIFIVYEIIYIG